MLTRVQIRAEGPTASEVEGELRWIAAQIIEQLGLTGELTDQVIEGTPEKTFAGRLSLVITALVPHKSAVADAYLAGQFPAGVKA